MPGNAVMFTKISENVFKYEYISILIYSVISVSIKKRYSAKKLHELRIILMDMTGVTYNIDGV